MANKSLFVRLPEAEKLKIEAYAKRMGYTTSSLVRSLIEKFNAQQH